jgi:CRISPR-associated protein Cmr4
MHDVPFLLQAISPLHAGTGQSADIIDLPIARMKSTGMPFVPGSSLKGVLRDACRTRGSKPLSESDMLAIFGPPSADADKHAGALAVGDARLLLLPVRSFHGTFAYVTSPLLLELARRDLPGAPAVPDVRGPLAAVASLDSSRLVHGAGKTIFLQDVDLPARAIAEVAAWAEFLGTYVALDAANTRPFTERFAIVDDETMTYLWETGTQLDTRVRINDESRTVDDGALWIEESLPPETVLIGLLTTDRSRSPDSTLDAAGMADAVLPGREPLHVQVGGKATVGRGLCRMTPLRKGG